MSVEICPVCGGKGLVPNGFYIAIGTPYYSTTSTSPETCRSCGGKGYIETYDEVVQNPELEELNERLKKLEELADTISLQQFIARTLTIPENAAVTASSLKRV